MGFSPDEVGRMSLWQFLAAWDGWATSKGIEPKPEPMSADELDRLTQRVRR